MPIPQHVVMGMLVIVILTLLALVLRSRLSAEKPGAMQQVAEMLLTNPMRVAFATFWMMQLVIMRVRSFIL